MISVTRHTYKFNSLPEALEGFRIAHITDIHRSHFTSDRVIRKALALAMMEKPDLILLTGDYVTESSTDIEPCGHLLSVLSASKGICAVLGNHDYNAGASSVTRMLTRLGITVLNNSNVRLENGLCIAGLEDDRYGRPEPGRALHGIGSSEPLLVLAHNPAVAELLAHRRCLVLSGHTHGGQILLPVLTPRELKRIGAKHYRWGWYRVGEAELYVNRGIGQVGLPIRFLCRPEVAIFTLGSSG